MSDQRVALSDLARPSGTGWDMSMMGLVAHASRVYRAPVREGTTMLSHDGR